VVVENRPELNQAASDSSQCLDRFFRGHAWAIFIARNVMPDPEFLPLRAFRARSLGGVHGYRGALAGRFIDVRMLSSPTKSSHWLKWIGGIRFPRRHDSRSYFANYE